MSWHERQTDLVERRLKYIQRQIALDKSAVNVRFRGQPPAGQRSGQPSRHAAAARSASTK